MPQSAHEFDCRQRARHGAANRLTEVLDGGQVTHWYEPLQHRPLHTVLVTRVGPISNRRSLQAHIKQRGAVMCIGDMVSACNAKASSLTRHRRDIVPTASQRWCTLELERPFALTSAP